MFRLISNGVIFYFTQKSRKAQKYCALGVAIAALYYVLSSVFRTFN